MKIRGFIIITAILGYALCFSACGEDEDEKTESKPVAIQFTGNRQMTGSAGSEWTNGDAIGVFMVEHNGLDIQESAINKKYTTTGNGNFTAASGQELFYPENNAKVNFITYYPYQQNLTGLGTLDVDVSGQQTTDKQASMDLLWTRVDKGYDKESNENQPVALALNHKLLRLVINCKADMGARSSFPEEMFVKIRGMHTRGTLDLSTGLLTTTGTVADILLNETTAATGFAASFVAVILPGSYSAGQVTVDFVINGETIIWVLDAETFEAGKEYEYEATIDPSDNYTNIKVKGMIRPWENENRDPMVVE